MVGGREESEHWDGTYIMSLAPRADLSGLTRAEDTNRQSQKAWLQCEHASLLAWMWVGEGRNMVQIVITHGPPLTPLAKALLEKAGLLRWVEIHSSQGSRHSTASMKAEAGLAGLRARHVPRGYDVRSTYIAGRARYCIVVFEVCAESYGVGWRLYVVAMLARSWREEWECETELAVPREIFFLVSLRNSNGEVQAIHFRKKRQGLA